MRDVSRSSSKDIIDTNDRRTIDHAEGKMEWDTKKFRRDKSWKIYRNTQYKPQKHT